eukprot:TRINITY_DN3420_c0_g1_i1.p1 TRINITY_DN3420_c0_g1~~TRINITY_DN3420_c0_g1_i1.p1  ORF type:complete len:310 (+),score=108.43 TRINITY_DN3420_c0_g1_i1:112-930(+)
MYRRKKDQDKQKAMVFDKSLSKLESCHIDPKSKIPYVLEMMLNRIDPGALKEERVFAVIGNLDNIHKLRAHFNTQKASKISLDLEPYEDVTSLIKIWLYSLPEAIIPEDNAKLLEGLYRTDPTGKEMDSYRDVLLRLPETHYESLRHLVKMIRSVLAYSGINGMEMEDMIENLAPYIFHKEHIKPTSQEKKDEKKIQEKKKKEAKLSKEEKQSKKQQKRSAQIQDISDVLRMPGKKDESRESIRELLRFLIERNSEIFVDTAMDPKGKIKRR